MALYGKLLPLEVNQKVEEKAVVRYETLEERRAAMIAKGWSPASVAALEEAMEPKFLRDMRRREEERMKVVEGAVDEVVEKVGESETERHEET
jgi:hypothetical protein